MRPALFLLAATLLAQEPRVSTTVRLVVAPATVTGREGRYIDGLNAEDFLVYDNGRRQKVNADVSYTPISLVIAVQSSFISAEAINKVQRIGGMIGPLIIGERGEAAVIGYDDEVKTLSPFTSDTNELSQGLKRLQYGGAGGRMVDAAAEAVRLLAARPPERRRVLLLIGESRDRGSKMSLEDAVTLVERANVTVYSLTYSAMAIPFTARPWTTPQGEGLDLIGPFREIGRLGKTKAAVAFTEFTGGARFPFLKQKGLEAAVSRIGEELHAQYMLTFPAPSDLGAEYHNIRVRIRNRPELTVRTRPGYWLGLPEGGSAAR
jgi:VWFA-related protein